MSSQFRPTRPQDAPAISQFMQEVFGMPSDHPGLSEPQMHWKYWRDHPGWEGGRGYMMERAGQIVAHGSVVPLTCLWRDSRLKMVDVIDWAARPGNPGAGITLLKRIAQMVDGTFIAGGTAAARKVFASLGFRDCPNATMFALPLRPMARFLSDPELSWKGPARLARNALLRVRASSVPSAEWSAKWLPPEAVAEARFPTPHTRDEVAVFERTPEAIAFLLDCPVAPAAFYLVAKGERICGYFVLAQAVKQCRIVDAWVEGSVEDWSALYSLALREASRRTQWTEIVTMVGNDAPAHEGLSRCGFRACGQVPLRFLIKGDSYPQGIRYQMVDNDNAWLHDGTTAYWM